MTQLPKKVAEKLNRLIPRDAIISYDDHLGWLYQKPSAATTRSDSKSEHMNRMISQNDREIESPLEKLGPFGICVTKIKFSRIEGSADMYEIEPNENLEFFRRILPDGIITGQHAPLAPVTLPPNARQAANIPQNATHFCWVYPPIGFTQLSEKNRARINRRLADGDPDFTFVALGGFAYFFLYNDTYHVLRVNTLAKAENGLVFNGPYAWRSEYTNYLRKRGRFQEVTISELLERGVKYYCFINPNEKLKSSSRFGEKWRPAQNGGFVYLYDKQMRPHPYDRYFSVADQPTSNPTSSHIRPFSLIRNRPQSSSASNPPQSATTDDENNRYICVICRDQTIRCLFIPCRHLVTCSPCAERIRSEMNATCPVCRERFDQIWDLFL